jgi:hypothetical protein
MASALAGTAIAWLGKRSVRADTRLRVHAPEQSVVAGLHRFVMRSRYELSFPAQCRAEIRMVDVEACFATMNHC